jgi:Mn2+/Fe2+ NRAMP family transporter
MGAVMIVALVMSMLVLMIEARLGIATKGMAVSEHVDPHLVASAPAGRTHS